MSESLAVRYRPRRFADLVGQTHVSAVLRAASKRHDPPPQLLFFGDSGLGKTTTARIFAAALFCAKPGDDGDACGTCAECVDIAACRHPDVIEMDAASNGGKDEIRLLAERATLTPVRARWKYYIIDECHAITGPGAQAMLRFLEDPPDHVVLAMATTNPEKLVAALRGRTLQCELIRPSDKAIRDRLVRISGQEGWALSPQLAQLCVDATDPELGIRGAVMTLSRLAGPLADGDTLTDDTAAELLGVLPPSMVADLTGAISSCDRPTAVAALDQLRERVSDNEIRGRLLRWCRDELVAVCARNENADVATWRYEKSAATPAGAAWTDVLVSVLAKPDLDQTPQAVRALLADAEATISRLGAALTAAKARSNPAPTAALDRPASPPTTRAAIVAAEAATAVPPRNDTQPAREVPPAGEAASTPEARPQPRRTSSTPRQPAPETPERPTTSTTSPAGRAEDTATEGPSDPVGQRPHHLRRLADTAPVRTTRAEDAGWGAFEDGPPRAAEPSQPTAPDNQRPVEGNAPRPRPDASPAQAPQSSSRARAQSVEAADQQATGPTRGEQFFDALRKVNTKAADYLQRFPHGETDTGIVFMVSPEHADKVRHSGIGGLMKAATVASGVPATFRVASKTMTAQADRTAA